MQIVAAQAIRLPRRFARRGRQKGNLPSSRFESAEAVSRESCSFARVLPARPRFFATRAAGRESFPGDEKPRLERLRRRARKSTGSHSLILKKLK
jgi:hypothetical protein